ncbi:ESPR-type extended signal peptide-containing protein, partial [Snodgrassella sp. CFCC 13594]|uniref:ESPR-type extended signal peptide-containing protein n=1 Tax=Snodgrassella sp. CFCC 13594 TaxID=1775559 RepID=UPI000AECFDA6
MNRIYKSKFNVSTGSWVACSELSSNKSKCKNRLGRLVLATMLGLGSSNLLAAECASLNGYGGGTCEIYENTGYSTNVGWSSILGVSGGAQKTVVKSQTDSSLGDFIANSNTLSPRNADYTSIGFGADNGTLTANKLSVTLRPESGKVVRVIGAQVYNAGQLTAKDLDVDVVFARESTTVRGPIESYAVQVGTAIPGADRASTKISKVTVENANLSITNTPNTQNNYIFWGFPTSLGTYQLSGIRIIRNEDNGGSNAIFESTGKVRINAYDSSNDNSGNYITGIYVSGDNNQAILNDSEIVIGKSGQYSSALKIGKGRATGTGGGEVVSKGQMILDTTAESTAPTIRLVGTGSKLTADSETSSAVIKSANNAILFGTLDYTTDYKSTDQQVALNNAKITTTSADASLVKTNAGVTGAKMTLKGSQSEATAAEKGWLVEVEDPNKWSSNQAALIFNLDNQAVAKGLMTVSGASTLEATVSNGAQWQLKNKGDLTEQRSTLSSFNLTSGGVLDAGTYKAEEYFVNVPEFNNNGGIISLINDSYQDKLTIEGNYSGSNGAVVKMNTLWNAPGSENGADSTSDILSITGTASGSTTVMPIKADGTENIIDGNVQQVASVLNTIPVVLVGTSGETAFTGTAQTTGATEVQLAKRTGSSGDEYYWTMSAKQPDTPTNPTNPTNPDQPS